MSKEAKEAVLRIAQRHGCLHGGKPSISYLLKDIGNGVLDVSSKLGERNKKISLPYLLLKITAPLNLSGVVAVVLKQIYKYDCDVYKVTTKAIGNGFGSLWVYFSIEESAREENFPEEVNKISLILNNLVNLELEALEDFNDDVSMINAQNVLRDAKKTTGNKSPIKENFISEISCTFGWLIKATEKNKAMQIVTEKVADKKIFISNIHHTYDLETDKDMISLFLEIQLRHLPHGVWKRTISEVINDIECIGVVDEIERIKFNI